MNFLIKIGIIIIALVAKNLKFLYNSIIKKRRRYRNEKERCVY